MIEFGSIFTPGRLEAVDLGLDDVLGQAELGNAVDQHPAGGVEGLEDGDVVAELGELARGGQASRAGTDDGDPLAGRRRIGVAELLEMGLGPVRDVALEVANGDRFALLAPQADQLALRLLGADPPGDTRAGHCRRGAYRRPRSGRRRAGTSRKRGMLTRTGQPSMQ